MVELVLEQLVLLQKTGVGEGVGELVLLEQGLEFAVLGEELGHVQL